MNGSEADQDQVPAIANDSWRTWLMTGVRRPPVGRRRVRGAHRGLKKMLAEGMRVPIDQPYTWKEFSDAMVRQSVGDAVRALPPGDAQVLKLAYFGGLSNEEIARRLDLTVAAVERRLRDALDRISEHVERGRSNGRKALGALTAALSGRWVSDAVHPVLPVGAAVAAAAIIALTPASGPTTAGGAGSFPAPAQAMGGAVAASAAVGPSRAAQPATKADTVASAPAGGLGAPATGPAAPAIGEVEALVQVSVPPVPAAQVVPLPVAVPAAPNAIRSVKTPAQLPFRV